MYQTVFIAHDIFRVMTSGGNKDGRTPASRAHWAEAVSAVLSSVVTSAGWVDSRSPTMGVT